VWSSVCCEPAKPCGGLPGHNSPEVRGGGGDSYPSSEIGHGRFEPDDFAAALRRQLPPALRCNFCGVEQVWDPLSRSSCLHSCPLARMRTLRCVRRVIASRGIKRIMRQIVMGPLEPFYHAGGAETSSPMVWQVGRSARQRQVEIQPVGGTLLLFDSVTIPHEAAIPPRCSLRERCERNRERVCACMLGEYGKIEQVSILADRREQARDTQTKNARV
jgi:hypothetical protein